MITGNHAEPRAFQELIQGTSSRRETQQIVRHLIAGCERCCEEARRTIRPVQDSTSWNYDSIFDRVERRLAAELENLRAAAPASTKQLVPA